MFTPMTTSPWATKPFGSGGGKSPEIGESENIRMQQEKARISWVIRSVLHKFRDMRLGNEEMREVLPDFSQESSTETEIRALIEQYGLTHELFLRSTQKAIHPSKTGKVTLDIYAQDLDHPDFVSRLESMVNAGCRPVNINFHILSPKSGPLSPDQLQTLKILKDKFHFTFSISDFERVEDDGSVVVRFMQDLLTEKILPYFIKISAFILRLFQERATHLRNNNGVDVGGEFESLKPAHELLMHAVRSNVKILRVA